MAKNLYLSLVKTFPLRPIRSGKELDRAIEMLDVLLRRQRELTPDEHDYLDVLSDLVERYEDEHEPIPDVGPADMLRHLLETRGLSQSQLARATGMTDST